MMEKATNTIAAGAIVSPAWLPSLSTVSDYAANLLPVLGCTWLLVQIVMKFREKK